MGNFFKQYKVKGIGTFINVLCQCSPLLGMAVSVVECGTFYTVQQVNIHRFIRWMTFPWFILFVVLIGLLVLFVFYKFVYPSYYAFLNKQTYIHENPMQKDLAKILKRQDKIMKKLGLEDDDPSGEDKS